MKSACLSITLVLASAASAQPAQVLPYARWHLSYLYSMQARLTEPGQAVDYDASTIGEVDLAWDMDSVGEKRFNATSKPPTLLRYDGTVVD